MSTDKTPCRTYKLLKQEKMQNGADRTAPVSHLSPELSHLVANTSFVAAHIIPYLRFTSCLKVTFLSPSEKHDISLAPKQELSFADVDSWVRQRFHLSSEVAVIYKNEDGSEILPTFSNKRNVAGHVKIFISTTKLPTTTKPRRIPVEYLMLVPVFLVLLLSMSCTSSTVTPYSFLRHTLSRYDLPDSLIVDIYTSFVSWTVSYFFVRRSLNPEYKGVLLERFAIDTLFGGLAAIASVVLKYILKLYITG